MGTLQPIDTEESAMLDVQLGEIGTELLAQWAQKVARSWLLGGGGKTIPADGLLDVVEQILKESIFNCLEILRDDTGRADDHDTARREMAAVQRLLQRLDALRDSP